MTDTNSWNNNFVAACKFKIIWYNDFILNRIKTYFVGASKYILLKFLRKTIFGIWLGNQMC